MVSPTSVGTDFNGILCDERTGASLQLPRRRPVLAIVTARPAKARGDTEAWLAAWGVRYQHLVLGPWPSWNDLPDAEGIGRWKAGEYLRLGTAPFVESDPAQARILPAHSGRPVLCPALGHLLA